MVVVGSDFYEQRYHYHIEASLMLILAPTFFVPTPIFPNSRSYILPQTLSFLPHLCLYFLSPNPTDSSFSHISCFSTFDSTRLSFLPISFLLPLKCFATLNFRNYYSSCINPQSSPEKTALSHQSASPPIDRQHRTD